MGLHTPSRPTLTRRQHELRDQLVELFLAEGFAHLTLDEVAARLGCSKRTLYALARSKDELAATAVRRFFARATAEVEAKVGRLRSPERRVTGYLEAVAEALRPASREFLTDMTTTGSTRHLYESNTAAASARMRELLAEGAASGAFRQVRIDFVAEVVTATMRRIGTGEVQESTGLDDAEAYAQLARLVVAAVRR
ncbi:TetR/AcrR family transcriptional regulator [Mariniluteicoccus flavus]